MFSCAPFPAYVLQSAVLQDHVTVSEMDRVDLLCSTKFNKSVWWGVRTVLRGEREPWFVYWNHVLEDTTGRFNVTYAQNERRLYNLTIVTPEAVLPLGGLGGRLGRQISGGGKFF
jgi:hypothetical protein